MTKSMHLPKDIGTISLMSDITSLGPYPPRGFIPIDDAALGNGDYFGLYWPLGRENQEPVVCDMLHDEWSLNVNFSSLAKFIEWLDLNDWERGDEEVEDDELPAVLYLQARELYSSQKVTPAIELLEKACSVFPEISEHWFALSSQFKRIGNAEEAANAALKSFNSNWVFGLPPQGVMRTLRTAVKYESLCKEPIVQRLEELSLDFGGVSDNKAYPVMLECMQEYFKAEQVIDGLMIYQNYGYLMNMETDTFQARHNFNLEHWQADFATLCVKHLSNNRTIAILAD